MSRAPEPLLLLDIGNTRLKWASIPTLDAPMPDAEAITHQGDIAGALAGLGSPGRWSAVFVASVMGEAQQAAIAAAIESACGLAPRFARSESACAGLVSAYAEPTRLGVDRWLAMLALWSRHRAAFVVASAGTALTFDAVDDSGQHLGGVIAPGLAASIEATLGRTRFSTQNMAAAFTSGLGRDTEACVRQGALHACAGLLDRLAAAHSGLKVLAGGDALALAPHLHEAWQVESDLVLQGLAAWAGLAAPP